MSKLKRLKIHTTINTLPVYGYWMYQKTRDIRYLLNVDYNSLPYLKKREKERFLKLSEKLFETIELNLSIQAEYGKCHKELLNYLYSKKDQKYNSQFAKYRKALDKYYFDFEFDGKVFENSLSWYEYYKSKFEGNVSELYIDRLKIFNYTDIKAKNRNDWDLYSELTTLQQILKIQINEFETSTKKYFSYRDRAEAIAKEQRNTVR